jgi:hypothetical protein
VIAADDEALTIEHRGEMTIAEVPGNPHQMAQVVATDLGEWFPCSDDFEVSTVLKHQSIALAKAVRLLEIEQEFEPGVRHHHDATPMAAVEIENDEGIRFRLATLGRRNRNGADHGEFTLKT